jgi:hypothetical protein
VAQPQPTSSGPGSNLFRNLFIALVALVVVGLAAALVVVLLSGRDSAEAAVRTEPIGTAEDPSPHRSAPTSRCRRSGRAAQ